MYSGKWFASVRLASTIDRSNQVKFPEQVGAELDLEEHVKVRTTVRDVKAGCSRSG